MWGYGNTPDVPASWPDLVATPCSGLGSVRYAHVTLSLQFLFSCPWSGKVKSTTPRMHVHPFNCPTPQIMALLEGEADEVSLTLLDVIYLKDIALSVHSAYPHRHPTLARNNSKASKFAKSVATSNKSTHWLRLTTKVDYERY